MRKGGRRSGSVPGPCGSVPSVGVTAGRVAGGRGSSFGLLGCSAEMKHDSSSSDCVVSGPWWITPTHTTPFHSLDHAPGASGRCIDRTRPCGSSVMQRRRFERRGCWTTRCSSDCWTTLLRRSPRIESSLPLYIGHFWEVGAWCRWVHTLYHHCVDIIRYGYVLDMLGVLSFHLGHHTR